MSVIHTIGSYVTAGFGYMSWCFSATDMACRPFLAFVALLGASAGTLLLVCVALSRLLHDLAWHLEQRRRARQSALERALVRAKLQAQAVPAALPEARMEPQLAPVTATISVVEDGWRDVRVAGATLTPPPSAF